MTRRIVVPVSGSSRSLAAIPVLAQAHSADVVALVLDLGQGQELEDVRSKALTAGAVRAHVMDVRDELARDYVVPALGRTTAGPEASIRNIAAPLVAAKVREVAAIEEAVPVLGNDDVSSTLWGRTGSFEWTRDENTAPERAAQVEITFEDGVPCAINSVAMRPAELIEILNIIAGHHGVGRLRIQDQQVEAPAAVVLHQAFGALQSACGTAAGVSGLVRLELLKGRHTVVDCRTGDTSAP
jgi:argininosuccinate synthase